jgi:hypothetical protein
MVVQISNIQHLGSKYISHFSRGRMNRCEMRMWDVSWRADRPSPDLHRERQRPTLSISHWPQHGAHQPHHPPEQRGWPQHIAHQRHQPTGAASWAQHIAHQPHQPTGAAGGCPLYVNWDPDVSGPMFKLTVVWAVGVAYSFEALLPSFGFSHRTRPPSPVASHATSRGGMAPRSSYRT